MTAAPEAGGPRPERVPTPELSESLAIGPVQPREELEAHRRSVVTVGMLRQSFAHADPDVPLVFVTASNRVMACRAAVREGEQRAVIDLHAGAGDEGIDVTFTVGRFLRDLGRLPDNCEVVLPGGAQFDAVFPAVVVSVNDAPQPRRQRESASRVEGES